GFTAVEPRRAEAGAGRRESLPPGPSRGFGEFLRVCLGPRSAGAGFSVPDRSTWARGRASSLVDLLGVTGCGVAPSSLRFDGGAPPTVVDLLVTARGRAPFKPL